VKVVAFFSVQEDVVSFVTQLNGRTKSVNLAVVNLPAITFM